MWMGCVDAIDAHDYIQWNNTSMHIALTMKYYCVILLKYDGLRANCFKSAWHCSHAQHGRIDHFPLSMLVLHNNPAAASEVFGLFFGRADDRKNISPLKNHSLPYLWVELFK